MLTPEHTKVCVAARAEAGTVRSDETPDWPRIDQLSAKGRAAVLRCPHPSHDAARAMFRSEKR